MPNWWDEDAPADAGGGEGNWWEEDADTPKKLTGVASAWTPGGTSTKKRSPLSLGENIQQQSTGFLGGLASELPNVGRRFLNLGSDWLKGQKETYKDQARIAGLLDETPQDISAQLLAAEKDWKARQQFERESAPAPNENLGMSVGRMGAKAAPQIAAGIATGGASIPVQAGVGGGLEMLQALSEGDSPMQAGGRAASAGAAPFAARGVNAFTTKFIKQPFASSVDQGALEAFGRLGIEAPASAVTRSPVAQGAEALAGKFIGGQQIADRARGTASGLLNASEQIVGNAGDASALTAGRNIAEDVLGAEAQQASRQAAIDAEKAAFEQGIRGARGQIASNLVDPALAAEAPQALSGGLSSAKGQFRAVSSQLREGIDASLGEISANPESFIAEADRLIAEGTLPPGDLAYLKGIRDAVSPRKMADIGGGQLVPVDQVPAEFRGLVPTVDQPRTAAEIQSQIRGMTQRLPYGQGEGVFGTPALKQGLAGKLKAEMGSIVSGADPDLGARLSAADAFHAENVGQFKTDAAKRIFKLAKARDVSKVADVIQPQMATEELQQLLKTTGARRAVSAKVLDDIIARASDKTGAVVPEKLVREVNRWRPGNLNALLTRDQIDQLATLGREVPQFKGPTGPTLGPTTTGEFLGNAWGKTVKGLYGGGQPGKVVETIVRPSSSPQEIAAAMKSAGKAAPEIQANALQRIFGPGNKMTPESVARAVKSWGGGKGMESGYAKLRSFLSDAQVQQIEDFVTASRALGSAGKITGGSQTAFLGNIAAIPERAARNPLLALRTLGLEAGVGKALGSAKGQKWLTTGLKPATRPGEANAAAFMSIAKILGMKNESERRRELDRLLAGSE